MVSEHCCWCTLCFSLLNHHFAPLSGSHNPPFLPPHLSLSPLPLPFLPYPDCRLSAPLSLSTPHSHAPWIPGVSLPLADSPPLPSPSVAPSPRARSARERRTCRHPRSLRWHPLPRQTGRRDSQCRAAWSTRLPRRQRAPRIPLPCHLPAQRRRAQPQPPWHGQEQFQSPLWIKRALPLLHVLMNPQQQQQQQQQLEQQCTQGLSPKRLP